MAGIPPPPSHMNPSSPAFAEWMRAIAQGLDDYTAKAKNYVPYSWAKTSIGATLHWETGWNILYQFEFPEAMVDDAWFDVGLYFCFDQGSNTLVNICPSSPVFARITSGESDSVVVESVAQYHGIFRTAIHAKKGDKIKRIAMWLKTAAVDGGACANDELDAVLISTTAFVRRK